MTILIISNEIHADNFTISGKKHTIDELLNLTGKKPASNARSISYCMNSKVGNSDVKFDMIIAIDQKLSAEMWQDLLERVDGDRSRLFRALSLTPSASIKHCFDLQSINSWCSKLGFYLRHDMTYNWPTNGYRDITSIEDMDPQFVKFIASNSDNRYELSESGGGESVRARHGHSEGLLEIINPEELGMEKIHTIADIPDVVYHGTSSEKMASINKYGLMPIDRAYVHTQVDTKKAKVVAERKTRGSKTAIPVILGIDLREFYKDNNPIWKSSDGITYLTGSIDPKYFIKDANVLSL